MRALATQRGEKFASFASGEKRKSGFSRALVFQKLFFGIIGSLWETITPLLRSGTLWRIFSSNRCCFDAYEFFGTTFTVPSKNTVILRIRVWKKEKSRTSSFTNFPVGGPGIINRAKLRELGGRLKSMEYGSPWRSKRLRPMIFSQRRKLKFQKPPPNSADLVRSKSCGGRALALISLNENPREALHTREKSCLAVKSALMRARGAEIKTKKALTDRLRKVQLFDEKLFWNTLVIASRTKKRCVHTHPQSSESNGPGEFVLATNSILLPR